MKFYKHDDHVKQKLSLEFIKMGKKLTVKNEKR